jgi:hypothetical protein
MVMLSSVAKPPPGDTPKAAGASAPPPLPAKSSAPSGAQLGNPPALPSKLSPEERNRVTMPLTPPPGAVEVRLPAKTAQLPRLASSSGTPITMPPVVKKDAPQAPPSANQAVIPPPLPAKHSESAPSGSAPAQTSTKPVSSKDKLPPLNPTGSVDSIFPPDDGGTPDVEKTPVDWKHLEPGELASAKGDLQSLEVFSRSQRAAGNVAPVKEVSPPTAKEPSPPPIKPAEKPALPFIGHVPPLLEKPSGSVREKLNVPHPPGEARKTEIPPIPSTPAPATPAAQSGIPKPPEKRNRLIPLFLFPPAKPKPKPPLPVAGAKGTPPDPGGSPTIKVEESKPTLKAPSFPTRVPGAPAKPPLVNPSVKISARPPNPAPSPLVTSPVAQPASKAPSLPTKVPGAPAKPPLVNPSAKVSARPPNAAPPPSVTGSVTPPMQQLPTLPTKAPNASVKPPPISPAAKTAAPAPGISTPSPASKPGPAPKRSLPNAFTLPMAKADPDKPAIPSRSAKAPSASSSSKSPVPSSAPLHAPKKLEEPFKVPPAAAAVTTTRSARARKRNRAETIVFYLFFVVVLVLLDMGALYFGRETRVEGQIIPPPGMTLGNEAWIVGDFRAQAFGIVDDLASYRSPAFRDIQEAQNHVQRAQADVAAREERIRLLEEQVQAAKDEIASTIKQAHDAAQQIWDVPGAQLEDEYNSRLAQLQKLFADRAKSLNLKYQPDDTYHSPEVWANAYRLALYDTSTGVDGAKEHQWLEDQMKQWRDFTKSVDDRQKQLREQAAQLQLATTPKVTDLNSRIDELQNRINGTLAEEEPLKAELQQAQLDLSKAQAYEAGLDDKYYKQLYSLPESTITKHLPLAPNGRFSWHHVEKDNPFAEGEKAHRYYLLVRAVRPDGRQYWAFLHLILAMNETLPIQIEPSDFISTKAILRPDLSPEEQQQ